MIIEIPQTKPRIAYYCTGIGQGERVEGLSFGKPRLADSGYLYRGYRGGDNKMVVTFAAVFL